MLGMTFTSASRAQGPDPFQPYNSQYAPFVTPVAPGPFDYGYYGGPGRGIRGANQFESYLNSLQTSAAGAGGQLGGGRSSFSSQSGLRSGVRPTLPAQQDSRQAVRGQPDKRQRVVFPVLAGKRSQETCGDLSELHPSAKPGRSRTCRTQERRVRSLEHKRPSVRVGQQPPRGRLERGTETSLPHRRPRLQTCRVRGADQPRPV